MKKNLSCKKNLSFLALILTTVSFILSCNKPASQNGNIDATELPLPTTLALSVSPTNWNAGQRVDLSAQVTPLKSVQTIPVTGKVSFTEGDTPLCESELNATLTATCSYTFYTAGAHTIQATYTSSNPKYYQNSSATLEGNGGKIQPQVALVFSTAVTDPIALGTSLGMTAVFTVGTGQPGITGSVKIKDSINNGILCEGTLPDAPLNVPPFNIECRSSPILQAGEHKISIDYAGNANYNQLLNYPLGQFTVSQATPGMVVTLTPTTPQLGDVVTVTATFSSSPGLPKITGIVNLKDGNADIPGCVGSPLSASSQTVTCSNYKILTAGNHTFSAHYVGDSNYKTTDKTTTPSPVNVQKINPTNITLTTNPTGSAGVNTPVVFTAIFTPLPELPPITGNAKIGSNLNSNICPSSEIRGGTLSCTQATIGPVGTHNFFVAYDGDTNYNAYTTSPTPPLSILNVTQNGVTINMLINSKGSSDPDVPLGSDVQMQILVTPQPPATTLSTAGIKIYDPIVSRTAPIKEGTLIAGNGNSYLSFSYRFYTLGLHNFNIGFDGDGTYSSTTINNAGNITVKPTSPPTLTLTANPESSVILGKPATLTATFQAVEPPFPAITGTLTFKAGGADIAGCTAIDVATKICNTTFNEVGTKTITAVYNGSSNYTPANSNNVALNITNDLVSIKVEPKDSTVILPLGGDSSTRTFTAIGTYQDESTGPITTPLTWTLSNEAVAVIVPPNTATTAQVRVKGTTGETTVTATNGSVSGSTKLIVKELVGFKIQPKQEVLNYGEELQLTATPMFSDRTGNDTPQPVTWRSLSPNFITVNQSGRILAGNSWSGPIGVTATMKGITSTITFRIAELKSIQVTPSGVPDSNVIPRGTTLQFSAQGHYEAGDGPITQDMTKFVVWTSGNPNSLTIDNNGLATGINSGVGRIWASKGTTKSDMVPFEVTSPANLREAQNDLETSNNAKLVYMSSPSIDQIYACNRAEDGSFTNCRNVESKKKKFHAIKSLALISSKTDTGQTAWLYILSHKNNPEKKGKVYTEVQNSLALTVCHINMKTGLSLENCRNLSNQLVPGTHSLSSWTPNANKNYLIMVTNEFKNVRKCKVTQNGMLENTCATDDTSKLINASALSEELESSEVKQLAFVQNKYAAWSVIASGSTQAPLHPIVCLLSTDHTANTCKQLTGAISYTDYGTGVAAQSMSLSDFTDGIAENNPKVYFASSNPQADLRAGIETCVLSNTDLGVAQSCEGYPTDLWHTRDLMSHIYIDPSNTHLYMQTPRHSEYPSQDYSYVICNIAKKSESEGCKKQNLDLGDHKNVRDINGFVFSKIQPATEN